MGGIFVPNKDQMPSPRRPGRSASALRATFAYFSPKAPPGKRALSKCRRRQTASRSDDNILRHGHPVFRHSHQMAAASKRQAPRGSGTRNMPHAASATGDLIPRKFVMSSGALASGQGGNLNKVLTTRAGNDSRMVNAPPRGIARRMADWRLQVGNFDATFGLCQRFGLV